MAEAGMVPDGQPMLHSTHLQEQLYSNKESIPDNIVDGEASFPRIADKVPVQVWIIILISTLERFAFFGLREPFRMRFPYKHSCSGSSNAWVRELPAKSDRRPSASRSARFGAKYSNQPVIPLLIPTLYYAITRKRCD